MGDGAQAILKDHMKIYCSSGILHCSHLWVLINSPSKDMYLYLPFLFILMLRTTQIHVLDVGRHINQMNK